MRDASPKQNRRMNLGPANGAKKRTLVVSVGATTQPPGEHRAVKGDEPATDGQKCEERREIAVADEGLPRPARFIRIEQRQHLSAAVSTSHSNEPGDRRIPPRRVDRRRSKLGRSGHISPAREHRIVVRRHESQSAEFLDTLIEFFALERAGGRD